MRKRLLDKPQCQAFLAKVATTGKKHRDHSAHVFDARNARVLLKHVLKTKHKEKPRLRLESRLWRGMRRVSCPRPAVHSRRPHSLGRALVIVGAVVVRRLVVAAGDVAAADRDDAARRRIARVGAEWIRVRVSTV